MDFVVERSLRALSTAFTSAILATAVALPSYLATRDVLEENLREHARRTVVERAAVVSTVSDPEVVAATLQRSQTLASPALAVIGGDRDLTKNEFGRDDLPRGLRVQTQAFGGSPAVRTGDGPDGAVVIAGSFLDELGLELYVAFPKRGIQEDLARLRNVLALAVAGVALVGALAGAFRERPDPLTADGSSASATV